MTLVNRCLASSFKFTVVALAILAVLPRLSAEQANLSIHEVLKRCRAAQVSFERVEMHGVTDLNLLECLDNRARHQRDEFHYRRDGERLDVPGRFQFLDKNQDRTFRYREVVTPEAWLGYSHRLANSKRPTSGLTSNDPKKRFANYVYSRFWSMPLNGYFPYSDGKCVAELLLQSENLTLLASETVDGASCQVIQGTCRYGSITVWIAEAKDFNTIRIVYEKSPAHLYVDGKPLAEDSVQLGTRKIRAVGWSAQVDRISFSAISGVQVPTAGRMLMTTQYNDGLKESTEYLYRRSDIDLRPNFTDSDAFQTDLPEGVEVFNEDDRSGVVYVWRGGKVVPALADFSDTLTGFWKTQPFLLILAWASIGAMLLIVSGVIVRRWLKSGATSR